MKIHKITVNSSDKRYKVLIGNNILKTLPKNVRLLFPKTKKIALIFDNKVPSKFKKAIIKTLSKYELTSLIFNPNEKEKSLKTVNFFLDKLFAKNLNRTDLIIGIGGGITGDLTGFIASIYKRGINFVSIPTTLLSQVDASIGGKTGVNSIYGKNLIGSFSQPKLVLSDISFLKSLSKKEMTCGYAEILKHALIKDKNFFDWLKKNTKYLFSQNEKKIRMILNFGHTFAHAIEVKNNYSRNTTHGEAVLAGIILATKLSIIKKICNKKVLEDIMDIYSKNGLDYTIKKCSKASEIKSLIPFLKNDKKNNDEKINFILIKKIGKTALPNQYKISINELKKKVINFTQY